ncbi:MAG TPA: FAD-binding protein [Herpetosiphon sp.]|uniref:L-aspartate oxidase n=1 Tax=Herpetosiphon aurantiacus (strain ATCC 23779 / DSM 785 / 114-95) TaxID=316274 RepID=A9B3V3_HERA2|nr:FAD-binding protein [Herpetosiphon sp.]ABX06089.1 Succinate dehydrogenase [Herpetosiphon aurantiacus DSM 785]HBW50135.1 FAD-binding protein [Herpetosiphon sp.]
MRQRYTTDVLVIGTGGAGLRAAIELHDQGLQVLLVGKRPKTDAHTVLAAGGINAALATVDVDDTWAIHAADTLQEGRMLGDPRMVELLCQQAPKAIAELEAWGMPFARTSSGLIDQRYFGAHRYRRTCFVGDYTGLEIIKALIREVERRQIPILERAYISDLLHTGNRVNGAYGFWLADQREFVIESKAVILATGGHIHSYQRSSSRRRENTGDGMALGLQVGAYLADMELVQFHPSGMIFPHELAGTLVTEAVRGEGGRLYNRHGERFMQHYDPERMELSTRDRVALANYTEIIEGRGTEHGGVWLDISHIPASLIHERLPRMVEQFQAVGVDITREAMQIAPTAHYSMGGLQVDPFSHATNVAGLYAAGEVTAGVHGANRLGGNSLAEILVFGRIAGQHAGEYVRQHSEQSLHETQMQAAAERLAWASQQSGAVQRSLIDQLQQLVWHGAGVVRNEQTLEASLDQLHTLRFQAQQHSVGTADIAATLDLQSMLLTAEATILAALMRPESRGAHQRSDYPATDPLWQRTIVIKPYRDEHERLRLQLDTQLIPTASEQVQAAFNYQEYSMAGRLVE